MDHQNIQRRIVALVVAICVAGACSMSNRTKAEGAETEKPSLAAREKIDSQLLQALDAWKVAPGGHEGVTSAITIDADGKTTVDITATVTDELLTRIRDLGGTVISSFPQYQAIRATIPADQLETLASMPQVKFIRPAEIPAYNKVTP